MSTSKEKKSIRPTARLIILIFLLLSWVFVGYQVHLMMSYQSPFTYHYFKESKPVINNTQSLMLASAWKHADGLEISFNNNVTGKISSDWLNYRYEFTSPLAFSLRELPEVLKSDFSYQWIVSGNLKEELDWSTHVYEQSTGIRGCYLRLEGSTCMSCLGYDGYGLFQTDDSLPNFSVNYCFTDLILPSRLDLKPCPLEMGEAGELLYLHTRDPYILLTDQGDSSWGSSYSWEEYFNRPREYPYFDIQEYTYFVIVENPVYGSEDSGVSIFPPIKLDRLPLQPLHDQ